MPFGHHCHRGTHSASPRASIAIGLFFCLGVMVRPLPAEPPAVGEPVTRLNCSLGLTLSGATISLVLQCQAIGGERTFQCSFGFPPEVAQFRGAVAGGLPAGSSLLTETNRAAEGRVGIRIELPKGTPAVTGSNYTLAFVRFQLARTTNEVPVSFSFEQAPWPTQALDDAGTPLALATGAAAESTVSPTTVEVISTESYPSGVAEVAIRLTTLGEEGSIELSVRSPPTDLKLIDIQGPRGLFMLTNIWKSATGLVGIGLVPAFPNTRMPSGTNILVIRYQVIKNKSQRLDAIPIVFDDDPFPSECLTEPPFYSPLVCAFKPGEIRLRRLLFEADVAPALVRDGMVRAADWIRVGRAVAGLESLSFADFEVADCAPRETRGDGVLSVADWVQAGRYYVGSDAPRSSGGPSQAIAGIATNSSTDLPAGLTQTVSVLSTNAVPGTLFTLPVQLDALGEENALGFSLRFDPAKIEFVNALASPWIVEPWLHRNTNNAAAGEVPVTLSLPPKERFSAGRREVIRLMFRAREEATGTAQIALEDAPLRREVVDVDAHVVPTRFNGATVTFTAPSAVGP